MKIGDLNIEGNIFSAPLAGISNSVFRRLCKKYGASATISEMVSVKGLIYGDKKTAKYLYFTKEEKPIGIQLFGSDADSSLRGLEKALEVNPDFIDFNFGCPVKKVIKQGAGSALLKDINKATEIIKTLVDNSPIPITAKLRSGWDSNSINFPEFARRLEDVGISAIFIHPRTAIQGFSGKADRELVRKTTPLLKIPVIYSGDINSPEGAKDVMVFTGVAGIMIGRAAMGDPHIFLRIKRFLEAGELIPKPSPAAKIDMLIEFYGQIIDFYGEQIGVKMMRKFIVWFTRGLSGNSVLRQKIFQLKNYEEIIDKLNSYKNYLEAFDKAKTI